MVAEDFEAVLSGKYPAKAHAKRVVELIRKQDPNASGVLYLESRHTKLLEDNDSPEHFRGVHLYLKALLTGAPFAHTPPSSQRRFFYYLTGCNLADSYFAYDIESSKSILFIPPIDPEEVIWSGLPTTIEDAQRLYDVDEVKLSTEVNATLAHLAKASANSTVYAIPGQVSDHITFIEFANKDFSLIKPAIEVARVVKDEFEVALIRKANHVSAIAHRAVVEKAKYANNETELEAVFVERCIANGAKEMAYHPIVASGQAAATLHYVPNNAPTQGKQLLLIDAGAEWNNYASDITRTFPLNGKFTKESREIYDLVLKMQTECISMLRAGLRWEDAHILAHKIAIDGLLSLGILKGDKEEIFKARISQAFFPHGLGHYLGMDTHDTGGNQNHHDEDAMFRNLRIRGNVPAGGVVTVEPGVYFCRFIIEPYLSNPEQSKYIDAGVLDRYWDVGGVRIEDNVLVTETGYENLTTAIKEPAELEALVAAS
ncbi:putative Xaa-Pro aminopeptidase [Escovopsis weberi]|uniref:Xaa-Pro aminopeptidase n=1 Tax=Escovopsis weberi TaxID=150374 RepID=A0A0M8N7T8_ESCWE|nr:putative Xaa-Pro aminopeptidase [Escovopsis weberi]